MKRVKRVIRLKSHGRERVVQGDKKTSANKHRRNPIGGGKTRNKRGQEKQSHVNIDDESTSTRPRGQDKQSHVNIDDESTSTEIREAKISSRT
jgi:hypothetical protein